MWKFSDGGGRESGAVSLDPAVRTPVLVRVAGVPLGGVSRVTGFGLSSYVADGSVEKRQQRVQRALALASNKSVLSEEQAAARDGVDVGAVIVEVPRVPHGHPVSQCDGDIPEAIDGAREVEIDERDGAATGDDDVLETGVVVAHERPRELARRSLVAPDRVWGRAETGGSLVEATLELRNADEQVIGRGPRREGRNRDIAGDEFEPLDVVPEAEDAGRARKPGALEVPEQVVDRGRPWPHGSPNRVAAARDAALITEPTGQDLLAGLHLE